MITDELLAELEAAAKAATPGDWTHTESEEFDNERWVMTEDQQWSICAVHSGAEGADCANENAEYISIANPATILALLAERAELKRDVERYQFIANTCEVILHGKEIEDGDELDAAMQEAKP